MDNVVATWITQNINIVIVVLLLLIGGVFKHWIQAVPNKYIPVILLPVGIVLGMLIVGFTVNGFIQGVLVVGVAVYANQLIKQALKEE